MCWTSNAFRMPESQSAWRQFGKAMKSWRFVNFAFIEYLSCSGHQRYTVRTKSPCCVHRRRAKGINWMTFPGGLQAMPSTDLKTHTCQVNGVGNTLAHSSESGPWLYCLDGCQGPPARSPCFYSCPFRSSFNTAILDLGHQGG